MKIAYFTDAYLPQVNGVTFVVVNHTKLLSKDNDVMIFAPSYGLGRSTEKSDDGKLIIERYPSLPVINYKEIHITFSGLTQMIISIKKFRPDVIHFATPLSIGVTSIIISKIFKIPLVSTYHTLLSETLTPLPPFNSIDKILKLNDKNKEILKDFIWDSSKRIYDYCNIIVAPTKLIKDELKKHNYKSKIIVVSNGIDTKEFKPRVRTKTSYKILYIGRLSYEKKVDIVIKSFKEVLKRYPKSVLAIVGGGPAQQNLEDLVNKFNIKNKVIFHGSVLRENLIKYYNDNDIFVTASEMEVQPLTILEAMACGLPIVGINRGGVAYLVKDNQNGFLLEPENYIGMSQKIIELLSNNTLRKKFSKKSRSLAKKESYSKSISKLEKIYKSLTSQSD
jgi:1,2-diacylglycerol 3-alpha-glucosyltransferase